MSIFNYKFFIILILIIIIYFIYKNIEKLYQRINKLEVELSKKNEIEPLLLNKKNSKPFISKIDIHQIKENKICSESSPHVAIYSNDNDNENINTFTDNKINNSSEKLSDSISESGSENINILNKKFLDDKDKNMIDASTFFSNLSNTSNIKTLLDDDNVNFQNTIFSYKNNDILQENYLTSIEESEEKLSLISHNTSNQKNNIDINNIEINDSNNDEINDSNNDESNIENNEISIENSNEISIIFNEDNLKKMKLIDILALVDKYNIIIEKKPNGIQNSKNKQKLINDILLFISTSKI